VVKTRVVDPELFVSDPTPDPNPTFKEVSAPTPDPDPTTAISMVWYRETNS
jgi:hypothetical protein